MFRETCTFFSKGELGIVLPQLREDFFCEKNRTVIFSNEAEPFHLKF